MSAAWTLWVSVVMVSFLAATVAFLFVYIFWLRRLNRRLLETQMMLYKLAALFQKAEKRARGESSPGSSGEPIESESIAMSVEGCEVEIIQVDGREMVRFNHELPESERTRILAYLKDEGFIS